MADTPGALGYGVREFVRDGWPAGAADRRPDPVRGSYGRARAVDAGMRCGAGEVRVPAAVPEALACLVKGPP